MTTPPELPITPGPTEPPSLALLMPASPPPRRSRVGLFVGMVAAVLVAGGLGAGAVMLVGGEEDGPPAAAAAAPSPISTTASPATDAVVEDEEPREPQTLEAAREAAQRGWDRFTAGDYGGTWDTYGKGVKDRISRADYIKVFRACNEALGTSEMFAVQVEDPRWFNDAHTKVTVTVKHPMVNAIRTMVYEDGRWVQEPQPATLKVIATFKKSGQAEAIRKHCTN